MANKISFVVDDQSIVAMQLTALDGLITQLNPNLQVGDKFAVAISAGEMIAIFEGGTAHPPEAQGTLDIPANGIPTGDYKVETCNTPPDPYWLWDEQTEVANITIINQDLKEIFDLYIRNSAIYNNTDQTVSGFVLDARQGKVLKDLIDFNTTHRTTTTGNPHNVKATEISDFDDEVGNHQDVSANVTKLATIEEGAEKNPQTATQTEMEEGTQTAIRSLSPVLVKKAIDYNVLGLLQDPSGQPISIANVYTYLNENIIIYVHPIVINDIAATGIYRTQYKFFSSEPTSVNWDSDPGIEEITSVSNYISIPKPQEGDTIYVNGEAWIACRIRFENAVGSTGWRPTGTGILKYKFSEPTSGGATADDIIATLAAGGDNAQLVINQIASLLSSSPKVVAMIAANMSSGT